MTNPVWGQLEKALDDNETIEEAIARLISEHENDSSAHANSGESLETHKTQDVMDHPQSSVVPDKLDYRDFNFNFNYQDIAGFDSTGYAEAVNMRLKLYVESGVNDTAWANFYPFNTTLWGNTAKNILLETGLWIDHNDEATMNIEWMRTFFEIEGDRIRGGSWINSDEITYYTDWYSIDMTKLRVIRALHITGENKTYFYIDGNLIGTVNDTWEILSDDCFFATYLYRNGSSDNWAYMFGTKLSLYED